MATRYSLPDQHKTFLRMVVQPTQPYPMAAMGSLPARDQSLVLNIHGHLECVVLNFYSRNIVCFGYVL